MIVPSSDVYQIDMVVPSDIIIGKMLTQPMTVISNMLYFLDSDKVVKQNIYNVKATINANNICFKLLLLNVEEAPHTI